MTERSGRAKPASRLTNRAKRVLGVASSEAIRLHHPAVEPEHVMLGLICDVHLPVHIAEFSTVEVEEARQFVESVLGRGLTQEHVTGIGLSVETTETIRLAAQEADALGSEHVEPKHLLLALIRQSNRTRMALEALGLSPEALRTQVLGWTESEPV